MHSEAPRVSQYDWPHDNGIGYWEDRVPWGGTDLLTLCGMHGIVETPLDICEALLGISCAALGVGALAGLAVGGAHRSRQALGLLARVLS